MATRYKKSNPAEKILVGDILMVTSNNQTVTRAIRDARGINERLVIGVTTNSDNVSMMPILLDGGSSKKEYRVSVGNANSEVSILELRGGNSELNAREYVDLVSNGTVKVGVDDRTVVVGDKLTISRFSYGKAEKVKISNTNPTGSRCIGKAVTNLDKGYVQALLNIE